MPKVIIGTDVSGNVRPGGQAMYIALVFGTPDSIARAYHKIGVSGIHMSLFSKSKRRKVLQNLDLNKVDLVVACLHVQRQRIIDEMLSDPRFKTKNTPRAKPYKHFDYLVFRKIRNMVELFAFPRKCDLEDIVMQCDSDMVRTGLNWRMSTAEGGQAYEIADVIAWCNAHDIKINRCKEIDLAGEIRTEMRHDLLK